MQHIEQPVLRAGDLHDGQMKQVEIGPLKVLVARVNGTIHAVGGTCPHYGAPLAEGVLSGDHVVCPWHQSHFSVVTGEFLEPPTLDCLPRYEARVEGEDVIVRVPVTWADRVVPPMAPADEQADTRTFVVLGGGAAGTMAIQTLREASFRGRVVLAGNDSRLPYDRPNLSKDYLAAKPLEQPLQLRDLNFYREHHIELRRGTATALDVTKKTITFDSGPPLRYDRLLICTGGRARKLDVPGADLKNVFTLRTYDDANAIVNAARPEMRAVVVGASFIGMEASASLTERGLSVTVIAPDKVPFARHLGEPIGRMFQSLHESKGVKFRLQTRVEKFEGEEVVQAAVLGSGERIEADLVVAGVGIMLNTGFARDLGLNDDGSITVDRHLKAADDIWAAGDVARFPHPLSGKPTRIEHWRLAEQHGRVAALNMAGRTTIFDQIPYFWSFQFGVGLDYVGFADRWDELIIDGDVSRQDFTCYYTAGDRILAAAGCGRSQQMCALSELMRLGRAPGARELRTGAPNFAQRLAQNTSR